VALTPRRPLMMASAAEGMFIRFAAATCDTPRGWGNSLKSISPDALLGDGSSALKTTPPQRTLMGVR
jgi:hypothetical protein